MACVCFECCKPSLFSDKKELKRLRRNWINIFLVTSLTGLSYFIIIPSLYQFVTSSKTPQDSTIQPGLGLSDTWYQAIISLSSAGELLGAVIFGIISRWFLVKHLFLVGLMSAFTGALFYGIGKFGWMLLIGRFLIGVYQGSQLVLWRTYIGESSEKAIAMLPQEKQAKSTLKYTNFFLTFSVGTTCVALGPSLSAVAAQIPGLDQFRWPGWFLCAHALFLFLVTLFNFREKKDDMNREGKSCAPKKLLIPKYSMAFIIIAFVLVNSQLAVLDTLINPILADNFGLEIKYLSYVFIAVTVFYFIANVTVFILQQCHVDNRLICLIAFFLSFTGSTLIGDWQSISGDPCKQLNDIYHFNGSDITVDATIKTLVLSWQPTNSCRIINMDIEPTLMSCDNNCLSNECYWLRDISLTLTTSSNFVCTPDLIDTKLLCYGIKENTFITLKPSLTIWTDLIIWFDDNGSGHEFNTTACNRTYNLAHPLIMLQVLSDFSQSCDILTTCLEQDIEESCNGQCDVTNVTSCVCELFGSDSEYQCFWNPHSRLTGRYCERCRKACLSKKRSLNFVQFLVGVFFLAPGFPMCRISLTILASDALGRESQGLIMGLLVASGSISRFFSPIWGDATYLAADHRTWLPMSVLSFCQLTVIVIFLILFRTYKIKKVVQTSSVNGELKTEVGVADSVELLMFRDINEDEETQLIEKEGSEEENQLIEEEGDEEERQLLADQ